MKHLPSLSLCGSNFFEAPLDYRFIWSSSRLLLFDFFDFFHAPLDGCSSIFSLSGKLGRFLWMWFRFRVSLILEQSNVGFDLRFFDLSISGNWIWLSSNVVYRFKISLIFGFLVIASGYHRMWFSIYGFFDLWISVYCIWLSILLTYYWWLISLLTVFMKNLMFLWLRLLLNDCHWFVYLGTQAAPDHRLLKWLGFASLSPFGLFKLCFGLFWFVCFVFGINFSLFDLCLESILCLVPFLYQFYGSS